MTCRDVHASLADGRPTDLPRGTREVLARHLAGCASCRSYVDSYVRTIALARDAERDAAPAAPPRALEEAILAARNRRR